MPNDTQKKEKAARQAILNSGAAETKASRAHPSVREAKASWSLLLAIVLAAGGVAVAMHPEWGILGALFLSVCAIAFLAVLGWWSWGMGHHIRTVHLKTSRIVFTLTAELAAISIIVLFACLLYWPKPQVLYKIPDGLMYYTDPRGDVQYIGGPKTVAPRMEIRIHSDGHDNYTAVARDNVLNMIAGNFHATAKVVGKKAAPDELSFTHLVITFRRPMSYTKGDVTVNFDSPNAPPYEVLDAAASYVSIAFERVFPEGNLEVYIDGTHTPPPPTPSRIDVQQGSDGNSITSH